MKTQLLFLLLIASIGCKKELASQGEQKMELTDFLTAGCNQCEITAERFRLDAEGSIVLMRNGDSKDNDTPLVFTKKKTRSYTIRDGDVIEKINWQSLRNGNCLYWLIVGDTARNDALNVIDLEINTANTFRFTGSGRRRGYPNLTEGDIIGIIDFDSCGLITTYLK